MQIITKLKDPNWWIDQILNDLYFACRNVFSTIEDPTPGYKDLWRPTHRLMCDFIQKWAQDNQKIILLCPRGWIKSYIVTVGWLIQRLLKNWIMNSRELWVICNATLPNAKEFLYKIKFNLQYNELLRGLFEQFLPKEPETDAERWTQDEIQIKGNRIELGSVERSLTSKHFRGGVNDDLVNLENSSTREQIHKVIDWWKLYQSLLLTNGIEIIPGTRYDIDDLYGYLINTFLKIPRAVAEDSKNKPIFEWHNDRYHLLRILCWDDPVKETGSTFPVLFPEKRLKEIQSEQLDRFGGQYLNDPLSMGNRPFQTAWFKRYREDDVPKIVNTIMTLDPTHSEKAESDYSGISVVDAGVDRKVYIRFAQRKLVTDLKLAEWMVEVACKYQPGQIGIEENKFQTLRELLELRVPWMLKHGLIPKGYVEYAKMIPYLCVPLKHRGRPKEIRIKNLTGWIQSGQFLFPPFGVEELMEEMIHFPSARLDDIVDALAYVLDLLTFPTKADPEKVFVLPEEAKMTDEERLRKEWEKDLENIKARYEDSEWRNLEDLY